PGTTLTGRSPRGPPPGRYSRPNAGQPSGASLLQSLELQDIEAGVRVRHIHQAPAIHEDVARRYVATPVDTRLSCWWWNEVARLFGSERIPDADRSDSGVGIRCEDDL